MNKMPLGFSVLVSVQFHLNWTPQCSLEGVHVHMHILCFTQSLALEMWYLNHSYILDSFVFKSERRKENILILHKYHVRTQWPGPCWSTLEVK